MTNFRTLAAAAALIVASVAGAHAQSTNATDADNKVGSQKSMDKSSMDKDGKMKSSDHKSGSGSTEMKGGAKPDASELRGHSETSSGTKSK